MVGDGENRFKHAISHLAESDAVMKDLIKNIGKCTLSKSENYYNSLLASIINQQLSGSAADSIYARLVRETGGDPTPKGISMLSPDQFRRAVSRFYLNGAKAENAEIIKIAEKWRPTGA
jgi:3-methyladenine DNA glycosylase/8-oxoguanine DNA glycosylase